MNRLLPAWRASLRLAVRSITRAKGRSALVALMVATPVALAVVLTTLFLTQDVSPKENLPARLGSSEALATYVGGDVDQDQFGRDYSSGGEELGKAELDAAASELARLTDGSVIRVVQGFASFGSAGLDVVQADFTRPATRGLVDLDEGRVPRAADEVAISANLSKDGDLKIGSHLTEGAVDLTVVGIGNIGSVKPIDYVGSIALLPTAPVVVTGSVFEFLIDRKAPVTWDDVLELNDAGFLVESRDVVNDPPSEGTYDGGSSEADTVAWIVVVSVMIEIILLAGPAFAVGVRRQRRELALIAAAGGSPRDIRRVVLAQAAVLGLGAGVVGAVVGLVLSRLIVASGVGDRFVDGFGPFDWSLPLTVLAILLGAVAALIAAYAPARQVSKEPLPVVLAGRRVEAGTRKGWPVFGLVVAALGLILTFIGPSLMGSDTGIAVGSIFLVVGVVFMTPTLIRFIARVAPGLPLPLRLALRDTARHTSRSAPAIAAVMAAVAGIVALGIGSMSDNEESSREYDYARSEGRAVLFGGDNYASIQQRVADAFPDRTVTPLAGNHDGSLELNRSDCAEGKDCYWSGADGDGTDGSVLNTVNYTLVAADQKTLAAWGVDLEPAQVKALADGKALVPTLDGVGDDRRLRINDYSDEQANAPTFHDVGVVEADLTTGAVPSGNRPVLANIVVSPATAKAFGLELSPKDAIISGSVSEDDEQKLHTILGGETSVFESMTTLEVERGFQSEAPLLLLLLAGIGGIAVLIGTLSATGLALNDARPDFATLNAIGAAPVTRRVMAAAQALTIGVMGVLLGIMIGTVPGVLAARSLTGQYTGLPPIVVFPWLLCGILLIAVPLLAAAASGVFIRNNNVAVRRVAG